MARTMPRYWAMFDLDGTLSDCTHRLGFAREKRWDDFHAASPLDPPHAAECAIVRAWASAGNFVAYNTGRTEPYRILTRQWLAAHRLPAGPLFMRETGDRRPSTEAKLDKLVALQQSVMEPGDVLAFVMEDQDKLVTLWRSMGLTCLQPRLGAF